MIRAMTRAFIPTAAMSVWIFACGQRDNVGVEVTRDSSDALGLAEVPCKKGSCPEVPVYIDGPNGSTQILANLDQDNTMSFSAKADRGSSRTVKMRVYYGPDDCKNKWSGQDSSEISCSWRPKDVQQSGKIKAIARDVSFCLEKLNQNAACQDMSKAIPEVDKEQEFQFSVEDNTPQQIDPAFIDNPGPQFGANGGLKGCGMGMLSGIVGVLQGSFMPAVMGCVNGYIGGLQQTQQYPSTNTGTAIGSPTSTGTIPGSTNTGVSNGF